MLLCASTHRDYAPDVLLHHYCLSSILRSTHSYSATIWKITSVVSVECLLVRLKSYSEVLLVSIWCWSNLKLGFNNSKLAPRRPCFAGLYFKPSLSILKTCLPQASLFAVFARLRLRVIIFDYRLMVRLEESHNQMWLVPLELAQLDSP